MNAQLTEQRREIIGYIILKSSIVERKINATMVFSMKIILMELDVSYTFNE